MGSPSLFIVAGPKGSGKGVFSKELQIGFEVFDGDKSMAALIKKWPETGSEALWSFVNENVFFLHSNLREVLSVPGLYLWRQLFDEI